MIHQLQQEQQVSLNVGKQEKRYLFVALCFVQRKPSLCFCAFKHRIGSAQEEKRKKKSSQHHDDEERFV
jgi:hypothetical protein